MSKHDGYVIYILNKLIDHIEKNYLVNRLAHKNLVTDQYLYNWSCKKWAAKEFYNALIEAHPATVTDLYLCAEHFVKFLDSIAYKDRMFSIAYDTAVELYDFVIGVL